MLKASSLIICKSAASWVFEKAPEINTSCSLQSTSWLYCVPSITKWEQASLYSQVLRISFEIQKRRRSSSSSGKRVVFPAAGGFKAQEASAKRGQRLSIKLPAPQQREKGNTTLDWHLKLWLLWRCCVWSSRGVSSCLTLSIRSGRRWKSGGTPSEWKSSRPRAPSLCSLTQR